MTRWRLVAELDGRRRSCDVHPTPGRLGDAFGATVSAIGEVLDRAAAEPGGPWALGRVRLLRIDDNGLRTVVHEMEAKR